MYSLVLYYLLTLLGVAIIESFLHILSYDPLYILLSAIFLSAVCWGTNRLCAYIWKIPANAESSIITALIIALIVTPVAPMISFFPLLWMGILSQVSKYILTVRGKHIFNPVAVGVALVGILLGSYASWWVGGTIYLMPFVIIGGLLIVRKIHRFDMVLVYIVVSIVVGLIPTIVQAGDIPNIALRLVEHTPIFFFAFIMLTEPLTTPPRRAARMTYATIIAALAAPWVHFGEFIYFTPETALLAGNVFSYFMSSPFKKLATLTQINQISRGTYEYVFDAQAKFLPGQYAEWTIHTKHDDSRGNRRYFTIASSPAEGDLRIGVKVYDKPSTYKQSLMQLKVGDTILAGSIAGDFTMPHDTTQKIAFIAGGIGITPFRSMVQHMIDTQQKRDAVLLYSNRSEDEIAYYDFFQNASNVLSPSFRVIHTLTDPGISNTWNGEKGFIDGAFIERTVPDYKERKFYISGPQGMVSACLSALLKLGVPRTNIHTDYFPGFA
ncbi:MAG: hypothetical protein JWO50_684 [Candidatus Kaiserbacteria bacterium]|nr:hypothetical protein [Candidatus Kaiserbacteria bacterium]